MSGAEAALFWFWGVLLLGFGAICFVVGRAWPCTICTAKIVEQSKRPTFGRHAHEWDDIDDMLTVRTFLSENQDTWSEPWQVK